MRRTIYMTTAAAVLTALATVGCYDSVEVTWYEPGVYKGPSDPLRDKLQKTELQQQLEDRLRAVQTDR